MKKFLCKLRDFNTLVYVNVGDNFRDIDGSHVFVSLYSKRIGDREYKDVITSVSESLFNRIKSCEATFDEISREVNSDCNKEFFNKISEQEKYLLILKWKHLVLLSKEDIDFIFDNSNGLLHDRNLLDYVFKNYFHLGKDYIIDNGDKIPEDLLRFIDYDGYGRHIVSLNPNEYLELPNGKIVRLNTLNF